MHEKLQLEIINKTIAEDGEIAKASEIDVVVHASIDSTNSWSLQQCRAGRKMPFACFAEQQTQGRGRRGKQWLMSPNSNIAMSLCWSFDQAHAALQLLPLSVAVAVARTLESFQLQQVQIKWPNDVYVSGKKIAGILIETRPCESHAGKQLAVVIGVGLNYDMSMPDAENLHEAIELTDICEQSRLQQIEKAPGRTEVATKLLLAVANVCQQFPNSAGDYLAVLRSKYDYCLHKRLEIITDSKQVLTGVALGINDNAELRVEIEGKECVFNSAEVSVKTSCAESVQ